MVFKGCQRCGGDLWVEEDIVSRLEELVCLQCGYRQAVGPNTEEHARSTRWLMSQRPSRVAA
jgi:DNA-directed RNA polymerase subunit RPC12/RpoP